MLSLETIFKTWNFLQRLPLGKKVFSFAIRFVNPYSGSLGAEVAEISQNGVRLLLKQRHRNRNHLDSIHAVALVNLGELCSGLAVLSHLGHKYRGIVTHIEADFLHKARGVLIAECFDDFSDLGSCEATTVRTDIYDARRRLVAQVHVQWKIGVRHESIS